MRSEPSTPPRTVASSSPGRRGEIIRQGGDGAAVFPEAPMEANPLTTVVIPVKTTVSLDLAAEITAAGKAGSPDFADLCAQVATRIVAAHERSPFSLASRANVSTSSSTG